MNESTELTDEQKEIKAFIRTYVKIMLYVPFFMILYITVLVIMQGIREGFI